MDLVDELIAWCSPYPYGTPGGARAVLAQTVNAYSSRKVRRKVKLVLNGEMPGVPSGDMISFILEMKERDDHDFESDPY